MNYPYEWCFSQLQAAARVTLAIQMRALSVGATLVDASAFNVPIHRGRPTLIDLPSLRLRREGEPWAGYRQFCEHFLAPLALMSAHGHDALRLWKAHIAGVGLPLASRLLPFKTRFQPGLAAHLHLHARQQARAAATPPARAPRVSESGLRALLEHLDATVAGLRPPREKTLWGNYYDDTNYSQSAMAAKERAVSELLARLSPTPSVCWDFGANDARFSRLAARRGMFTLALDLDPAAIERAWETARDEVLPLVMDLSDPSGARGFAHTERLSLLERGPADVGLALALIHHLAIAGNVPLSRLAEFFADACRSLILEFVPKEDSQVQRLLAHRPDIFPGYHRDGFLAAFGTRFEIRAELPLPGSKRTLFLLERKAT